RLARRVRGDRCAAVALALAGTRCDGDRVDRRYRRLFHRAPFRPAQARAADQSRQDMGRSVWRRRRGRRLCTGVAARCAASRIRRPARFRIGCAVDRFQCRARRIVDRRRSPRVAAEAPRRREGQRYAFAGTWRHARSHRRAACRDAACRARARAASGRVMRTLTLLGATGSIGDSALDVVARHPDRFTVAALAAHRNGAKLLALCRRFRPRVAALHDVDAASVLARALAAESIPTRVVAGAAGLVEVASLPEADTVLAAIVGAAGLPATLAAARAGKRILLANKEALVIGGRLFMEAVDAGGATLVPIDSEHNAVHQCLPPLYARRPDAAGIRRILLTASGGP